jgi:chromate transporter
MREVFLTFLQLGMSSFGGPIAHLGYFRREFVIRRAWLDDRLFTQIVALCSVLPGPTSSQVGLIVGLLRAGPAGALAAWLGFTLPSAIVLASAAAVLAGIEAAPAGASAAWLDGLLAGFTAAATAIVAQAVIGMAKTQCPDPLTQTVALAAGALALSLARSPALQWVPIAAGAAAGALLFARSAAPDAADALPELPIRVPRAVAAGAAVLFVALVTAASIAARHGPAGVFLATIVRAGSLVFGGGHVVLPLLQTLVPAGLISGREFFAGYGVTQAMPGPLFTFAAFLGSANHSALHGWLGATLATVLIFVPSFLLVFACLPVLRVVGSNRAAIGAIRGASAAVVGLLGALLYSPLITSLGTSIFRITLALGAFALVAVWRIAPWIAVLGAGAVGALGASAGIHF